MSCGDACPAAIVSGCPPSIGTIFTDPSLFGAPSLAKVPRLVQTILSPAIASATGLVCPGATSVGCFGSGTEPSSPLADQGPQVGIELCFFWHVSVPTGAVTRPTTSPAIALAHTPAGRRIFPSSLAVQPLGPPASRATKHPEAPQIPPPWVRSAMLMSPVAGALQTVSLLALKASRSSAASEPLVKQVEVSK